MVFAADRRRNRPVAKNKKKLVRTPSAATAGALRAAHYGNFQYLAQFVFFSFIGYFKHQGDLISKIAFRP